ncbi:iron(III) transport system ATP-binding protein [Shimia gijangensis]|uniref:Iron(III) transport system ATP-binding protein n=1 Tax=Shimia gijangensis TaxID=1470563 RepID=A0A1M6D7I3_9RHOB|nr:putative 2-aminoethylphosphonate ABC transporter ATP-binding protein [Shimia gijangensis]SHI69160.1 iron(III) transport system ATP-binding protein [Shimia gijangensis]
MTAYLDLCNVSKSFGNFAALQDISFRIPEGRFVCFVGPSGCGKTTLLRLIAGLETPDRGDIVQQGQDVTKLPPAARDFGIVFQSYALFPNLTSARNVAYGLQGKGLSRDQIAQRVLEMLTLVGLPEQEQKFPSQLSGGQQQRVALARALAPKPGLLLLDEPLSALDAKERERLRQEIRDVQHRLGVTTVMVTHDQEEALAMADTIVVMNAGRIEQIGTPAEVYQTPKTPFVAGFIGETNWLDAVVETADQARLGTHVISCQQHGFAKGTGIRLALRPEDLIFAKQQGRSTGMTASIREISFRGPVLQVQLALAEQGMTLQARAPATGGLDPQLQIGDQVDVTVALGRAQAFVT